MGVVQGGRKAGSAPNLRRKRTGEGPLHDIPVTVYPDEWIE